MATKEKRYEIVGTFDYYFQDHPRLGSGHRTVVAHSRGNKFIQLLELARLLNVRILITDWDSAKRRRPVDLPLIRMGRAIALRLSELEKFQIKHSANVARGILQEVSNDYRLQGGSRL